MKIHHIIKNTLLCNLGRFFNFVCEKKTRSSLPIFLYIYTVVYSKNINNYLVINKIIGMLDGKKSLMMRFNVNREKRVDDPHHRHNQDNHQYITHHPIARPTKMFIKCCMDRRKGGLLKNKKVATVVLCSCINMIGFIVMHNHFSRSNIQMFSNSFYGYTSIKRR